VESLDSLRWIIESSETAVEDDEYSELGQNLLEITDSIKGINTMNVSQLLEAYKALEGQGKDATDGDAVNVMTIHQSKGLEWDAVFIPRFVEGALPTSHAKTDEQLDEERRLAYVGITRARHYLELSWGETYKFKDRTGAEKTRSQSVSSFEKYLKEAIKPKQVKPDPKTAEWNKRFQPPPRKVVHSKTAPKKPVPSKPLTDYEILSGTKETMGSVVMHKTLGQGKIVAVASSYAIVDFGKEGRFKIELPPY
jgi:ATP-dependent exoDNAse (exonuclease V) beta subunit